MTPNAGSQWRAEARELLGRGRSRRACTDAVLDDEFPLSLFYEALKKKVAA